jgi:transcriptional regulator with XRE-family HTH domain
MASKKLICTLRLERAFSIKDLAEALDITVEEYIEVEMGSSKTNSDFSTKIEGFFNIPIDDLLLPTPPPHQPSLWSLCRS